MYTYAKSPKAPALLHKYLHAHMYTYIYIYIYICVHACVCRRGTRAIGHLLIYLIKWKSPWPGAHVLV